MFPPLCGWNGNANPNRKAPVRSRCVMPGIVRPRSGTIGAANVLHSVRLIISHFLWKIGIFLSEIAVGMEFNRLYYGYAKTGFSSARKGQIRLVGFGEK